MHAWQEGSRYLLDIRVSAKNPHLDGWLSQGKDCICTVCVCEGKANFDAGLLNFPVGLEGDVEEGCQP